VQKSVASLTHWLAVHFSIADKTMVAGKQTTRKILHAKLSDLYSPI